MWWCAVLQRIEQEAKFGLLFLRANVECRKDLLLDIGDGVDANEARLRSVSVPPGAAVVGRALGEMRLDECGVTVSAVRRRGIRALSPGVETRIEAGDVVVLLGGPSGLEAAEQRLLGG